AGAAPGGAAGSPPAVAGAATARARAGVAAPARASVAARVAAPARAATAAATGSGGAGGLTARAETARCCFAVPERGRDADPRRARAAERAVPAAGSTSAGSTTAARARGCRLCGAAGVTGAAEDEVMGRPGNHGAADRARDQQRSSDLEDAGRTARSSRDLSNLTRHGRARPLDQALQQPRRGERGGRRAQRAPGAVQELADGAARHAEGGRDLLVGAPFELAEDQAVALALR